MSEMQKVYCWHRQEPACGDPECCRYNTYGNLVYNDNGKITEEEYCRIFFDLEDLEAYLESLHGKNWKDSYEVDVKACGFC